MEAMMAARADGNPDEARERLLREFARAHWAVGNHVKAAACHERLIEIMGTLQRVREQGDAMCQVAACLQGAGDFVGSRSWLKKYVSCALSHVACRMSHDACRISHASCLAQPHSGRRRRFRPKVRSGCRLTRCLCTEQILLKTTEVGSYMTVLRSTEWSAACICASAFAIVSRPQGFWVDGAECASAHGGCVRGLHPGKPIFL